MKAQGIRLADVFFIGPLMFYAGRRLGGAWGDILAALGILTIAYNGGTYLQERQRARLS
jgi:hypothetical protein